MSTLVLDTNIVSFLMRGDPLIGRYRRHLRGNQLAIAFMTVAELYEGACRRNWSRARFAKLRMTIARYLVIGSTMEICRPWGEVRYQRRHQPIASDDAWIAATALAYDCPLVTHNPADFYGIPGLQLITELH